MKDGHDIMIFINRLFRRGYLQDYPKPCKHDWYCTDFFSDSSDIICRHCKVSKDWRIHS